MSRVSAPPLECRGVSVDVRLNRGSSLRVLSGVSVRFDAGATAAIVGTSGSGKTTLLSVLGLLQRPTAGSVLVGGTDIGSLPDARQADVRNRFLGFVFQDAALIDHLSVGENVALPLTYGRNRPRAREVRASVSSQLSAVGLPGYECRRPAGLSGGERQRVAVARSLVRHPSVLLADEPTGALDERTGEQVIRHLLSAVENAGCTLVLVTHDSHVAARMDVVHHLSAGRLRGDTA